MAAPSQIVVTLSGEVVPANRPIVCADDAMALRGDGVFETLLLRDGRGCLLDAHLDRLARSAASTALSVPDPVRWRHAVAVAIAEWTGAGDAVLRLTCGRGGGAGPTAFVTVSELPARVLAARRDGVSAMTLDRGLPSSAQSAAPWSLAGAKSMSYATNAAALRHAERLGFDDVLLVSSDGCLLEGPRSSVVMMADDGVLVTPPETLPILPGTTVRALFEVARKSGRHCRHGILHAADLVAAQGVWLLSSVTLAARVHTLDGRVLPAGPGAGELAELVDLAVSGESPRGW